MGRQSLCGGILTDKTNKIVGFCLGHGGYCEQQFETNEEVVKYVEEINNVPKSPLFYREYTGITSMKDLRNARKQYKKDFGLINKHVIHNMGTYLPMYSKFILRPSLNVYTRDFTINNTGMNGRPALEDGDYTLLAIESITKQNSRKEWIEEKIGTRQTVREEELIYSPDYCNSLFTSKSDTVASYAKGDESVLVLISKEKYEELPELIIEKLRTGYLSLMYGTTISPFLSLLFLDRLVYGENK